MDMYVGEAILCECQPKSLPSLIWELTCRQKVRFATVYASTWNEQEKS